MLPLDLVQCATDVLGDVDPRLFGRGPGFSTPPAEDERVLQFALELIDLVFDPGTTRPSSRSLRACSSPSFNSTRRCLYSALAWASRGSAPSSPRAERTVSWANSSGSSRGLFESISPGSIRATRSRT